MIPYQQILRDSSIKILKEILTYISKNRIGDSSLIIFFKTNTKDVILPVHIKQKYPDETAISLNEDCFNDLKIEDKGISLILLFGKTKHKVYIPFDNITKFADTVYNVSFTIPLENVKTIRYT
jgi:hypothetical protein